MISQFADMTSSPNFFDIVIFLLSSLVTGPSFMLISLLVLQLCQFSFNKGLTRNSEIRNTPFWVFPSIQRLGQVRNTKFGVNVCYEMIIFTDSELLRENHQGGKIAPTQIRVNTGGPLLLCSFSISRNHTFKKPWKVSLHQLLILQTLIWWNPLKAS